MAAEKKCCVPNCGLSNEILHKFPNPNKDIDRFRTWIYNVGGDILGKDNEYIFKYRRVCHLHFESKYHTRNKTLSINAVPTLRLSKNGIRPEDAKDTADLLIFIDKSFDSMNGSLQKAKTCSGKELLRNVTPNTLHKNIWTQSKNTLKSMKFVSATGSPGISRRSVARIVKERNTPQPSSSKPWRIKTRKIRCDKIILDEYEEGLLRRKIHEFYAHKQEVPTVNKLYEILREEIGFQGSREILRKIIKNIGFKYVRSKTNRRVLVERNDLSASRAYYLQAIKQNEETEKLPVIYLDETCMEVATIDGNNPNKKQSYLIMHAGSKSGFIHGADLIVKAHLKFEEDNVSQEDFILWVKQKLAPNLKEKSLIVMNNAVHHNKLINSTPTYNSSKEEIQVWLQGNGIIVSSELTRPQLIEIVKKNRPEPAYVVDAVLNALGHKVLRIPPFHNDLNPMGKIWARLKRQMMTDNIPQDEVPQLIKEKLEINKPTHWLHYCGEVSKIEEQYRKHDVYLDDPCYIDVCFDSGSSDDDDDDDFM
ncbi:uncharacterized protein LOC123702404 [Colias croceus]|uniref:uncharacterized protein LOC123702404 n=1 Tax=Colias crocea TaxID=72248 RepID=UPI001E27AECC|nr:uncharacterized protein LOC123702404 [Colias croceus]